MKRIHFLSSQGLMLFTFGIFFSVSPLAQVGIGNTDPSKSALLDIRDDNEDKGILIPRVSIPNLLSPNPVTTATSLDEGLLVYNTNDTTGRGFYYWNGSRWVRIDGGKGWQMDGNAGTSVMRDFLGTTDDAGLMIKTNSIKRFIINSGIGTNGGQIRAYMNGIKEQPTYSWVSSPGTGMFMPGSDILSFSTGSIERLRIPNGNQIQAMYAGSEQYPFYSWNVASSNDTGMYLAGAHKIGFSTRSSERFRIPNADQVHAMKSGTAGRPFYSWDSDPLMGMYRVTTNTLGFSTNGFERVRISSNGNVGIGTTSTPQLLNVSGNFKLDGAFMPGDQSGSAGKVLLSAGADLAPTWGAEMVNINQIARFITSTCNIDANTVNEITVPVPGLTNQGTAIVNLSGDWEGFIDDEITIHHTEIKPDAVRFVVSNNTLETDYLDMYFTITVIR